ncbi:MAG: hypothetical protein WCV90_04510 [Candidatus Woesearchaeota archaeon]|jgi:hypothetical protein
MQFHKKGMEAGFLVALIIIIVSGLMIGVAVMKFSSNMDDKEAEILCRDTIAFRAQTAINLNDNSDDSAISAQIKAVPALCKTVDKMIKGDKEQIMEQMAQKIARCWWMFGEGRYDNILGKSSFKLMPTVLGTTRQPNQCFNCYNLMIDQDSIPGGVISNSEFMDYLTTHSPPNMNGSVTYVQYIQQYGGPGMLVNILKDGIKPRGSYAISILPMNAEQGKTNWLKIGGFVAMGVGFVGAVACSYVTLGACAPFAMSALTTLSTVGGTAAAVGLTDEVRRGEYTPEKETPTSSEEVHGNQVSMDEMFKERERSSIYVSDAAFGSTFCGSGDLAGK